MKNILVVGDICDDVYYFSYSTKDNPESDKPLYPIKNIITRPGMAANVCLNLETTTVSPLILNNVKGQKIQKIRHFHNDEYMCRIDVNNYEKEFPDHNMTNILERDIKLLADGLIISDYGKGFWNEITSKALPKDIPSFVDPSKDASLELYKGCSVITPNLIEGRQLAGKTGYFQVCETIFEKTECKYVILKLGAEGALLFNGYDFEYFDAVPTDVVDVCGAGDTFISAIAYFYLMGYTMAKCVEGANKAASLTVSHLGVYAPTKEEWASIKLALDSVS